MASKILSVNDMSTLVLKHFEKTFDISFCHKIDLEMFLFDEFYFRSQCRHSYIKNISNKALECIKNAIWSELSGINQINY